MLNSDFEPYEKKGLPSNSLMQFAELLCELSKYNPDLKAILENSQPFAGQSQNQNLAVNPYAINNNVVPKNPFESNSSQNAMDTNNVENKNDASKGNVGISGSKPITVTSICDLLTSQRAVRIDTSKLPEEIKKLVNGLVGSNKQEEQN